MRGVTASNRGVEDPAVLMRSTSMWLRVFRDVPQHTRRVVEVQHANSPRLHLRGLHVVLLQDDAAAVDEQAAGTGVAPLLFEAELRIEAAGLAQVSCGKERADAECPAA